MTKISVIIPAYNESGSIVALLRAVRAVSVPDFEFEIVVIDDGSRDGTGALLQSHPELHDRLILREKNGGKGAAVRDGLRRASGEFILFQDADLEYDPAEYAGILYPVAAFGADVVIGSRFLAPRYTRVHYFVNKVGNLFITALVNVLYNRTFTDIYCCYLLYRRSLIDPDGLRSSGWEQHAEIICRLCAGRSNIYEVPVSYHGRTYEEGKKIRAKHFFAVVGMIFKSRFFRRSP
jgi:glycosyltransferase involved in cell wall biosynthesis